jgi:hypothetical protein
MSNQTTLGNNRRERRAAKSSAPQPTPDAQASTEANPSNPKGTTTGATVAAKPKEVIERATETITKLESKSALIRRLYFKDGMTIGTISKATKIRYQMVRNVVKAEETKALLAGITANANGSEETEE